MSLFRLARHSRSRAALVFAATALVACGGGGDGGTAPPPVVTSITVSPAAGTTVTSGGTIQLNAVVLDQNGKPMTGQTVTWTSANTARATVSQNGVVSGLAVGTVSITASIGNVTSTPITITVVPGAAAALTKVAELPATMAAGAGDSVRTRVQDANGNGVPGVTVSFTVTGAGSTLSASTAVTDANGFAGVRVILGNTGGQVTTVTATTGAFTQTFTTTGVLVVTSIIITAPTTTIQVGGTVALSATVRDQFGNTMGGQSVTWISSNNAVASITAAGLLTAHTAGTVNVTATIGSVTSNAIAFTISSGPPASFVKVGDLSATMTVGSSDSVRVRVLDAGNSGVPGITVTFTVSGGGSTISATTRTTDANGFAGVRLTIGPTAGQVTTVTASVNALPNLTFTTTSVAGAAARVAITSPRVVVLNKLATTTVTAGSTDAFGNPVAGPAIVLLSRNQSIAKVSGNVVTADTTLGQTFISARWSTDSTVRDSMLVVVAHPTGPVIMSNLQRFDFRTDTVFTIPVIVDMRASGEKLGSTRVQISWNTAALTYVSDAEGSSNVGATVNTSNAASGVITLAVASSSGYTGAVEIRRITFRASVTAARSTLLTFGASELNGVSPTFTDLKPKTVGVSYPIHTR